jgi:hypothetical protein
MRGAAARVAGRAVHVSEAAELVAAEVLSAFPLDEDAEGTCDEAGVSRASSSACTPSVNLPSPFWPGSQPSAPPGRAPCAAREASSGPARPLYPPALQELLDGLDQADAFSIDERLCRALALERSLDGRIGPLLAHVWNRFVHRALGFLTREAYARERLGMDPTRARALVRVEQACALSAPFARAYRSGALSWVKASRLVPIVHADPLGKSVEGWVEWAGRITARRLDDDVDRALALAETQPLEFARTGGLPAETHDREIGAPPSASEGDRPTPDPWVAALESAPAEICWARFMGPADVVQLFKAVLCTVRRQIERETGRLPTSGEALGAMLDHAFGTWGFPDEEVAARHKIYARDGWRCAAPGCSSLQNLHDHHIRFRSAGGSDDAANRVTLCAFHHLRGVHAGLLRCVGKAPDGLRWEMGIRRGVTPVLAYRSGDVCIHGAAVSAG